MIVRYMVVDKDNTPMGATTTAPPSAHYLDTMNAPSAGGIVRQGQPYRVVKLIEDTTYTRET